MIKGFSLDIYDCEVSFAWDTNRKELEAFLDQVEDTEEKKQEFFNNVYGEKVGAVTVCYGGGTNCITIFHDEPNNKVTAHEIYHIAYRILSVRGIEDEEAWAYLIGYITEMFYDLYLDKVETEEINPEFETHYIKAENVS